MRRKSSYSANKTILALLAIFTLAIGAFFAFQNPRTQERNVEQNANAGGNLGQTAPSFEIRTIEDNIIKSEDLNGKPTVLWFMAAWCPTCIGQAQDLKQINRDLGDEINILTIDLWVPSTLDAWKDRGALPAPAETKSELQAFKERFGGDWIWALDTDEVTFKYGIIVVDTTILLDKNGEIIYRLNGPTGYDDLIKAIKEVL